MKLKKLIGELPLKMERGTKEIEITGLCSHSKRVAPGNLFIAKKGTHEDGAKYIEEAITSGAVAILTDFYNPFLDVAQLVHPNVAQMEGILASRFYGHPSKSLFTVGVTGTNGKTTTTYLIKHLFDHLQHPCGLIGTVEYIVGQHHFEASLTTPDVITNQKLLKEMHRNGCTSMAMEATSIGLAQGRCDQIEFDAAIFTNLSQDHLDYHHTMEEYAREKGKLFRGLASDKYAIVNEASPWTKTVLSGCSANILTFGFTENADLYAYEIQLGYEKTNFWVKYGEEKVRFTWKMIGKFNILNCLAAIGTCLIRGFSLQSLTPYVESFHSVPGRLERVENCRGLNLFVDHAHTPDALENALSCLRELKKGRVLSVFGCGGDRDRGKRTQMGAIAEKLSDFTFITSDNPRSEDPLSICEEIAKGCTSSKFAIEVDRRQAIAKAIKMATPQDLILIAGKGHETYQLFAHRTLPFDDRKVAKELADQKTS